MFLLKFKWVEMIKRQKFALWIHLSRNMFNQISLGPLSLPDTNIPKCQGLHYLKRIRTPFGWSEYNQFCTSTDTYIRLRFTSHSHFMDRLFFMCSFWPQVHNHNNKIIPREKKVTTIPPAEHIQQQFDTMCRCGRSKIEEGWAPSSKCSTPILSPFLLAMNIVCWPLMEWAIKWFLVLAFDGTQHH